MTSAKHGRVPQQLVALAQRSAAPHLTEASLADRFGPRSHWQPAAGQLWRAVRADTTALVLLLAVDAEAVTAAPATVDSTGTGGDVVVVGRTTLGVPVTVWASLRRALPVASLDRPVDDLGADVVYRVTQVLPGDLQPGGVSLADEDSDVRAELLDDLEELAETALSAVADPAGPASAAAAAEQHPVGIDLDDVTPAALDEAAQRLGEPLPVLLDLIDGKRLATPAQAHVLREVLGAAPVAATPPTGLVIELFQPRWRSLVRQHRQRGGGRSEDAARSDMAYQVVAMAARQTGDAEPSWPDRIRRWAQAHQLNPDTDA